MNKNTIRRMCGTSRDLDWDQFVAPVLSDYCGRMMAGGYPEKYRKDIDSGVVPLNRRKGYKKLERRSEKKWKRGNWANKGGECTPIIVPSTPGGILCK